MRVQEILENLTAEMKRIQDSMDGLPADTRAKAKERLMLIEDQIEFYQNRNSELMDQSNLGRRFRERTFENFESRHQEQAYMTAMEYARRFQNNKGEGLLFMGSPGTGKTHLAAAITNHIVMEQGTAVKFGNFIDILSDIKKSFSTDDDIVRQLKEIPLLVIDDLGKERRSEWSESILYDVINGRYEDYMPTIITTNLTPKQLEERFGSAVLSRLSEMCTGVVMNGMDYRRRS